LIRIKAKKNTLKQRKYFLLIFVDDYLCPFFAESEKSDAGFRQEIDNLRNL